MVEVAMVKVTKLFSPFKYRKSVRILHRYDIEHCHQLWREGKITDQWFHQLLLGLGQVGACGGGGGGDVVGKHLQQQWG